MRALEAFRLGKSSSGVASQSVGGDGRALPGRALLALSSSVPEGDELVSKPVVLG